MPDIPAAHAPAFETWGPPRWKTAFGVSLAAHLALAAALFFGLQQVKPPRPTSLSTAMAIRITLTPATPAIPAHQTPPEREKPRPIAAKKIERHDLPLVANIPNAKAEVTLPPRETPPPPNQTPPPPAPTAEAPPAKEAAAPVMGAPLQGVTTVEQNYDAEIIAKLERRKRYPSEAMRQYMEDVVYLHMVIDRTGRIVSSDIVRSRHFDILDNAVRDLVKRVNPLPQMPNALPGDSYAVTVPIDFFVNHTR